MEQDNLESQVEQPMVRQSKFTQVTPLSKNLAMILFILMPFIGGWVGYHYALPKIVEVEKIIKVDIPSYIEHEYSENPYGSGAFIFNADDYDLVFNPPEGMAVSHVGPNYIFLEKIFNDSTLADISIFIIDNPEQISLQDYVSDSNQKREETCKGNVICLEDYKLYENGVSTSITNGPTFAKKTYEALLFTFDKSYPYRAMYISQEDKIVIVEIRDGGFDCGDECVDAFNILSSSISLNKKNH